MAIRFSENSDGSAHNCIHCSARVQGLRELYAVCERADRTFEGGEIEAVVGGMIAGIPFVLPSRFGPIIERREGEDVVVSVPLPVCEDCWNQLDGGGLYRILATCSRVIFIAGVVVLVYSLFARTSGAEVSLLWPLGILACALPPYFIADRIRSHWGTRVKRYMRAVPQYDALLNTFPKAEILTNRPDALMKDDVISEDQPNIT